MRKLLISLLLVLVVVPLGIIVSVRFFPQLLVSVFNNFSTEQASVNTLNVSFFPLDIQADGVNLSDSKGIKLVTVQGVNFSAHPVDWMQGKQNFWKADLANVNVQLHQFPESIGDSNDEEAVVEKLNIHQLLCGLNLKASDVHVQLDDKSYLRLNSFNTDLNDDGLTDYTQIEQDITFSFDYVSTEQAESQLSIDGVLQSRIQDGVTKLGVVIPSINLTSMFASSGNVSESEDAVVTNNTISVDEGVMDWQWLSLFEPLELDLSVGAIEWSKSTVKNLNFVLKLDKSISFTHQSDVSWLDSDEMSFEDKVVISGEWMPVSETSIGADLRGQVELVLSSMNLKLEGDINVNGINGNSLLIAFEGSQVPIKSDSLDEGALKLLEQYFPIKTEIDVEQTESMLDVNVISAQFGESDVQGSVKVNSQASDLPEIKAELKSTLFSFISLEDEAIIAKDNKKPEVLIKSDEKELASTQIEQNGKDSAESIFNSDVIDWSWLDGLNVSSDWQAKKVLLDDIEVSDLSLPLSIASEKLVIEGLTGGLAGGTFNVTSSVSKQQEKGVLNLKLDVADVVLEQLNLLPPEELKQAPTHVSIELSSIGGSTQALASSLNGFVRVNVGEGVIGNDSFELVGSDLLLSLLNKLNPFAKSDKTTDLECAVVNLNVVDGKVEFDKSFALRTSKLTMVANGHIDLNSEKIKLSLTPKARSGIGVDVSSLVKFIALGGTLNKPVPTVTASGLLKSAVVVGAAVSTGGVSLLATSAAEKTLANVDVCKRADNAFN